MTVARAAYITYRTRIFDGVLNSFVDNKFGAFRAAHDLLNLVRPRLTLRSSRSSRGSSSPRRRPRRARSPCGSTASR